MRSQFDPDYWHNKAEEVLCRVDEMSDPDARRTMLQIARMCHGMAAYLEKRTEERPAAPH
jgi:hypothetical protein